MRKAQNVAMNLSEMESKVREATNNEPWGASTSLMSQIAAGTYNYREREEILSFIFRRFTEKAANEWRQIYKSLQLLDYLIKNGSERIIDDVRSNASLIQMLKSFHYIDSKGRDQGINVRNRSKNLLALLNDDALIRLERKKARGNAKKFGGVSSAAFGGASSIAVGDGFGGDDDFTNRVYGDGGVYGARYDDPASAYANGATGTDNNFEEYDVEATSSSHASKPTTGSSKVHATSSKNKAQPQAPQQDLLGDLVSFDGPASGSSASAQPAAADDDDDDDFDDFQTAPSLSTNTGNLSSNLANLYVSQPAAQRYQQPTQTSQFPQVQQQSYAPSAVNTAGPTLASTGPAKPSNDAFSSLFSTAKTKSSTSSKPAPTQTSSVAATKSSNDDDFFGGFSSNTPSAPAQNNTSNNNNNSGEIDLLSF